MRKTFNVERFIGQIHPFGDGVFEDKNLFVLKKDRFLKAVKPQECIGNDIVFTRDKVNARVELLNIVEPAIDVVRCSVVSGDVEVVSMDV